MNQKLLKNSWNWRLTIKSTKIILENLYYKKLSKDYRELFSTINDIKTKIWKAIQFKIVKRIRKMIFEWIIYKKYRKKH